MPPGSGTVADAIKFSGITGPTAGVNSKTREEINRPNTLSPGRYVAPVYTAPPPVYTAPPPPPPPPKYYDAFGNAYSTQAAANNADTKAQNDSIKAAKDIQDAKDKVIADKKAADKVISDKKAADKVIADENAAIEAESQRLLAESAALTEATEARAALVKGRRDETVDATSGNLTSTEEPSVEDTGTESKSSGLIGSFMPDIISESTKGEGNYSPEWVEKNKIAGANHLEALYASGELQRPISNFTDASGNAIGGISNSEDNTAMQQLAADGVADPLTTLSKEVSDGTGLDTSISGAWRQAVDGADGHEFEGGSGLLNYSKAKNEDTIGIRGEQSAALDEQRAQERADAATAIDARSVGSVKGPNGEDIPVDDLSSNYIDMLKFSGNLGFDSMMEAQTFWDSMTPEAQAIFNSKERPELSDKILSSVFGAFMPGFGLLNKFMYNDDMSLQEKLEFSSKTAVTVANNKDQINQGGSSGSGGGSSVAPVAAAPAEKASEYTNLDSYLNLFNNYKF